MRNAKRASQTEILDYPERLRRECKKGPAMPIPSLWTRRRAGTGGRSDILEGQRHHRCRKVGIGLDHDDLALAGLDRDGVGALIGQHQIDLVLANLTVIENGSASGRARVGPSV